jgi:hypothetical protein
MNGERKAELRSILEGFNLNKTGLTLVLLTVAVLAVGVLVALLKIL